MKKTVALLITFLLSVTSLFYAFNRQTKIEYERLKRKEMEKVLDLNQINENLNKQLAFSAIQNIVIEDVEANQHSLSDLVLLNPVLIYRFSESNCGICYETELAWLQVFFAEDKQKAAILSSHKDRKYFVSFKRINRIELPIFRISLDALDWIVESYKKPYYFVLHPDLTVSDIYVPDMAFPELKKQYLEKVKKFLSE